MGKSLVKETMAISTSADSVRGGVISQPLVNPDETLNKSEGAP
jgi:hypothetical protein